MTLKVVSPGGAGIAMVPSQWRLKGCFLLLMMRAHLCLPHTPQLSWDLKTKVKIFRAGKEKKAKNTALEYDKQKKSKAEENNTFG